MGRGRGTGSGGVKGCRAVGMGYRGGCARQGALGAEAQWAAQAPALRQRLRVQAAYLHVQMRRPATPFTTMVWTCRLLVDAHVTHGRGCMLLAAGW